MVKALEHPVLESVSPTAICHCALCAHTWDLSIFSGRSLAPRLRRCPPSHSLCLASQTCPSRGHSDQLVPCTGWTWIHDATAGEEAEHDLQSLHLGDRRSAPLSQGEMASGHLHCCHQTLPRVTREGHSSSGSPLSFPAAANLTFALYVHKCYDLSK